MQLQELLTEVEVLALRGDPRVEVDDVVHDSHHVRPGSCFACVVGARTDGHVHAPAAVAAGAVALIVERALDLGVAEAEVADVRVALGPAAAAVHGHPSRSMRCLGVTGTNGKTTTTFLLEAIARAAGEPVGVVGTTGAKVDGSLVEIERTTPEATDLQALLAQMRDAGVRTVAMEVSSHALAQHRVDGTWFACAGFTNLSHEHLDFHGSLEEYFEAKTRLFDPARTAGAAINVDDPFGVRLSRRARDLGLPTITFGIEDPGADLVTEHLRLEPRGARFTLRDRRSDEQREVRTTLLGRVNVSNALTAAGLALGGGLSLDVVASGLSSDVRVPGRLEPVDTGQPFTVLVDYAHTPDALTTALTTARDLAGPHRVIVVFGCGGDRDRAKRPLMGRVAAERADLVVVTSDNPRSEPPEAIAAAIIEGLVAGPARHRVELDRRSAIQLALDDAEAGDVVVVAGKGHETGQTTGGVTVPFDDRLVVRDELGARVELTAGEIAAATGGEVIAGSSDAAATSFSIDSRTTAAGGCFVALEAARDGHDFVDDAFARGATVAIVRRTLEPPTGRGTLVRVEDPAAAVTTLAGFARARLEHARVVGITGSAGKTATKDLTTAALARSRRVHASPLSFNNELGVPLTLLGAEPGTDVVVAEMGARFEGNIADICAIARPDVGVVTHIGMAHAEHLGGPAGIARVKGELMEALPTSGLAVLNDDDAETSAMAARTTARVIRVGSTSRADVVVEPVELDAELRPRFGLITPWGTADARLELRGAHQAVNAAMAASVAVELGVPLADAVRGLADARPQPHRMAVVQSADGVAVINDAYNSSPTSAAAALRALAGLPVGGRRVAVLGEMRELGPHAEVEHARVGELAGALGIDVVVAVGDGVDSLAEAARAAGVDVARVADVAEAGAAVAQRVAPGDAVLVKASRAVGLDGLAEALIRGKVAR